MIVNVNDYVRVKLTAEGRRISLARQRHLPAEDDAGWSRWQLWDLMHVFGERCFNGCNIPFETSIDVETQTPPQQPPMRDSEKLIWATTFSASIAAGCNPLLSVRLATRAVQRLRDVEVDKLPEAERAAVEQIRGDR